MRAGKRLDPFPNSYTGDPLAAYRLNIAKAGYPSWMMLSMDELGRVPAPTPELLEAGEKLDEEKAKAKAKEEKEAEAAAKKIAARSDKHADEVDKEAAAGRPVEHHNTKHK